MTYQQLQAEPRHQRVRHQLLYVSKNISIKTTIPYPMEQEEQDHPVVGEQHPRHQRGEVGEAMRRQLYDISTISLVRGYKDLPGAARPPAGGGGGGGGRAAPPASRR